MQLTLRIHCGSSLFTAAILRRAGIPGTGSTGSRVEVKIRTIIPAPAAEICMQSQVGWGIALTVIGAVVALILPICGLPIIAVGVALLIWRGREDTIEEIKE